MNLAEIVGKSIAMIVFNTEKDDDVQAYLGQLQLIDGEYTFVNEEKGWKVSLDDEQFTPLLVFLRASVLRLHQ